MSLAGATHDRKGEASSPKTSRAGLRSKLQEMKASLSNQSHMESKEVNPVAPVSVIAMTGLSPKTSRAGLRPKLQEM